MHRSGIARPGERRANASGTGMRSSDPNTAPGADAHDAIPPSSAAPGVIPSPAANSARHVDQAFTRPTPYGTLFVNVVGSFVLGWLVTWSARVEAPPDVKFLIGTGLCGALTTFSTFSVESLHLFHQGHRTAALANVLLNVVLGLGAAAAGMALAGR